MRFVTLLIALLASPVAGFSVSKFQQPHQQLQSFAPLNVDDLKSASPGSQPPSGMIAATIAAASGILTTFPLVALAVEDDSYEYGAVDAPIGLAVGGGLLAILTAAVPVLLRPGEEALEEQRKNEGESFGTGRDILNKRR